MYILIAVSFEKRHMVLKEICGKQFLDGDKYIWKFDWIKQFVFAEREQVIAIQNNQNFETLVCEKECLLTLCCKTSFDDRYKDLLHISTIFSTF